MFRNMFRSKAQRAEDQVKFNERMFPLGDAQRDMTEKMVYQLTKPYTDEPLIFYYYLSAADHYYQERGGVLKESKVYLNKIKPNLPVEGNALLYGLMELSLTLKKLSDFPSEKEIIEVSKRFLDQ